MLYRTILKLFGDIKLGAALPPLLPSLFHFNFPPLSLSPNHFWLALFLKSNSFPQYSHPDCSSVQFGSVSLRAGSPWKSLSPSQISHFADECLRFSQFFTGDAVREGERENLIDVIRPILWDLQCFCSSAHCRFWLNWPHILSYTHG